MVGPSSLPVVVTPSLTEDSQTERERSRTIYTSSCTMLTTIAQKAKKNLSKG